MAENFLNRLARNPYAPIDAASVTRIDEMGNGLDDWGNIIAQAPQQPQAQSWGELGYGIATAPMRFGNALMDSVNPYKGNEHPITQPDASNWQVPPLLSESWDALNSFGNAYSHGMSEDDMRRNANIAAGLTMGGGGLAARPAGGVGMFAGRLAKTADHEALARAEQMATQGADRRAIWDNTGWFQGPDSKWRFEIDDSGAKLSDWNWNRANDTAGITQESSIGGGLVHPYLWDAYPDIADADMRLMKTLDDGSGAWSRDSRTAYVRGRTEPEARSVGLHEVQHAIQGDEGFARGGSRRMFTPEEIAAERARIGAVPEDTTGWSSVGTGASDAPDTDIALGLYKRLAGETEARNVQTRMNMSADERKASPPWETQDIPDADQIVRMYSNASKEASVPAIASGLKDRLSLERAEKDDILSKPWVASGTGWWNISLDGNQIGKTYVREYPTTIQHGNFSIDPEFQRQGIGTEVQKELAQRYGKPTVPDGTLSEAAYQRWLKNDPAAVDGYEPWAFGAGQYRPKPGTPAYLPSMGAGPAPGTRASAGELFSNSDSRASLPALLSAGRAEAGTGTAEGLHLGGGSAWPNPQHAGQMADDLQGHIPAHQNPQGQASRSLIENDPYLKAWADHLGLDYDGLLSPAIAKAATDRRFEHYGIRATPYKMEAGTTPPNSTQWYQDFIDEEQSRATFPDHGEDLGGASTVGIEFTPEGVARARERIGSYWEPNELGNDFVSLLGSDKAWQGADIGENVLKDSVVLSQHPRSRYGETLFSNSDSRASLPALASGVGYDQDHPYLWPWR